MSNEKPAKPSEQLRKMTEALPVKCPLAIGEVISSLARCEMVYDNCDDAMEKYFAKEAKVFLQEIGAQMVSMTSHPNIAQIVESSADGL